MHGHTHMKAAWPKSIQPILTGHLPFIMQLQMVQFLYAYMMQFDCCENPMDLAHFHLLRDVLREIFITLGDCIYLQSVKTIYEALSIFLALKRASLQSSASPGSLASMDDLDAVWRETLPHVEPSAMHHILQSDKIQNLETLMPKVVNFIAEFHSIILEVVQVGKETEIQGILEDGCNVCESLTYIIQNRPRDR